jgi:hypothetical protein
MRRSCDDGQVLVKRQIPWYGCVAQSYLILIQVTSSDHRLSAC